MNPETSPEPRGPMTEGRTFRLAAGVNTALFVLFAVGIFVLLNYLSARRVHWQWDVTASKSYTLSERTKSLLRSLDKDVTLVTILSPGWPLTREVNEMLVQFHDHSRHVKVEPLPIQDKAQVEARLEKWKQDPHTLNNSVVFECGDRVKVVQTHEMQEFSARNPYQMQQEPPKFKGESAFASALLNVTQAKQVTLYFTKGHGEADLTGYGGGGLSEMEKVLKANNMKTGAVELFRTQKVPDDCDVLVIPGPTKRFAAEEIAAVDQYLQGGGNVMLFLDVFVEETGLEKLAKDWGIEIRNDILIDPQSRGGLTGIITSYGLHKIVEKMKDLPLFLPGVRTLKLESTVTRAGKTMKTTAIVETTSDTWTKTAPVPDIDSRRRRDEDARGPFTLAAVSEEEGGVKGGAKARLIVVGDADHIQNNEVNFVGLRGLQPPEPGAEAFFTNAIYYCTQKHEMIDIPARSIDRRLVTATDQQISNVKLACMGGIPAAGAVLGLVVWLLRRRR